MADKKYDIIFLKGFEREFNKLSTVHKEMVADKILLLQKDPFYPSLRTKKMRGGFGYYESSVNMDIRLIWQFRGRRIILLIDVGHHDILKKY